MKSNPKAPPDPKAKKAKETLRELVGLFEKRGWLDRTLRMAYGEKRYRLFCDRSSFVAYRINDHCGISPGIPGWPVCFVTPEKILENTDLSESTSSEPLAREWVRYLMNDELKII